MSVEWEQRGPAAWVTFNRPEAHNAMTFEMYEELHACCERADSEDEVRVLVLRGAGEKAFVAGTDIRQFLEFSGGEDGLEYERTIDRIVGRLERVRKPTIALVDGFAMLALSAERRTLLVSSRRIGAQRRAKPPESAAISSALRDVVPSSSIAFANDDRPCG